MTSKVLEPKELRRLIRRAAGPTLIDEWRIGRNQAEILLRYHASRVFNPSQFYVSYEQYKKHIEDRQFHDYAGSLIPNAQVMLALYCMRQASRPTTISIIEPVTREECMEILHAFLSRGTQELHDLSFILIGLQQERMPFIRREVWEYAKDTLVKAGEKAEV